MRKTVDVKDGAIMSRQNTEQDLEFVRLASAYLDGIAADEELRSLADELRGDPEARKVMAKLAHQHGELRLLCAPAIWSRLSGWADSDPAPAGPARVDGAEDESWNRGHLWRACLALAATLLVGAGIWWLTAAGTKTPGADVSTGKGQTMSLRFVGEKTLVEVAEDTKLKVVSGAVVTGDTANAGLARKEPEKLIQLETGSIKVSVEKQVAGGSFAVKTRQAEMRVVGTKFSAKAGGNMTRLDVEEGVVRFERLTDGATIDVPAGHFAEAREGVALAAHPVERKPVKSPLPVQPAVPEDPCVLLETARARVEAAIRACDPIMDNKENGFDAVWQAKDHVWGGMLDAMNKGEMSSLNREWQAFDPKDRTELGAEMQGAIDEFNALSQAFANQVQQEQGYKDAKLDLVQLAAIYSGMEKKVQESRARVEAIVEKARQARQNWEKKGGR
ncbi:MAG: hypothetical protein C0404_00685 [Verrucomicrobia bacterium]|nr:hypothetical protein [Verrucomicrobiota bacterium]